MPSDQQPNLIFPDKFFWGCSTSAHQIEGGLVNDWSEWEKSPSRLAQLRDKQLDPRDFISGAAANSYENAAVDLECLDRLGANAYRFSLDWSRIEPVSGQFNAAALDYYHRLILKLRAKGIEPFLTLWHWPLPLWVSAQGGWENQATVDLFGLFVAQVAKHLDGQIKFWITLNEPLVYVSQSYIAGEWPPQKRSRLAAWRAVNNLAAAHKLAYQEIKKVRPDNQVGIANHNIFFEAAGGRLVNRIFKSFMDWRWNYRFLNKISEQQDFIGLNYYFHSLIDKVSGRLPAHEKVSDLGWGLHPEGIYEVLAGLKRYQKPIYVTENGLADHNDQHREWYIGEIVKNLHRAISDGVDLRGYLHWSLIDNFEWAYGFSPRFGLYETDYRTYERRPRPAANFYEKICRRNGI